MKILQIRIHARDEKRSELLQACQFISDRTLQESGCIKSHSFQDNDDENFISLEQEWDQLSSLNDYFRSDHFTALLGAMKWLGRSYEIRINGGSPEEGMKIIKSKRGT